MSEFRKYQWKDANGTVHHVFLTDEWAAINKGKMYSLNTSPISYDRKAIEASRKPERTFIKEIRDRINLAWAAIRHGRTYFD